VVCHKKQNALSYALAITDSFKDAHLLAVTDRKYKRVWQLVTNNFRDGVSNPYDL
jgi:hypothetical protein